MDGSIERRTTTADEPFILRARWDLLNIVIEGDICECELQLLGSKESSGTATAFVIGIHSKN